MGFPSFSVGEVLTAADMNAVGLWRVTSCTVSSVGGTAATASNGVITIGSNNTSVTVSNAFSADYSSYYIMCRGGTGSAPNNLTFQLSGITGSVYRQLGFFQTFGTAAATDYSDGAGSTSWLLITTSTDGYAFNMTLHNPQATVRKFASIEGISTNNQYIFPSLCNSTASATGFTLSIGAGNFSGGTIRVYGYRN